MSSTLQLIAGVLLIGGGIGGMLAARRMEPNAALWRLQYGIFAAYGVLVLLSALLGDSPYEIVLAVSQLALALLTVWNVLRIFRASRTQGKAQHRS